MNNDKYLEKIHNKYLNIDKKCNSLDLELWQFRDFIDTRDGDTEHERTLLAIMEREINDLRYTIECYKKELDKIHQDTIKNLK